ncbi:class I SAM-dependent methyltransferase [Thalassospiraceae bacterium LMO-JJ14]|nr:class I SAM-dependent methyltransferase [Thalassospiraceae bacterium LMO-JJ14]
MTTTPEDSKSLAERLKHWDQAYKKSSVPPYPSQFAVFVCDYLSANQNIVEFGCGSGRDSIFFAWQGYKVVGLDGSGAAIDICHREAARTLAETAEFRRLLVEESWDEKQLDQLSSHILGSLDPARATMVYARFFLHILTAMEQKKFLDLLMRLSDPGMMYAFEFRTHRDQGQSKIAQPHYRRFIDPIEFIQDIKARGFKVDYFIESFGMAKYKTEDAHVARVVFHADDIPTQKS